MNQDTMPASTASFSPPALPSSRSYAIVGTGALGGFYGARLQRAGLDVHFLLRSDFAQVQQQGLIVDSIDGDFKLPVVQAYHTVADMPACDVVIVSLKTTQNHLLNHLLPSLVKPTGVVLVLQNGLNIEPAVADLVGSDRVMGGLCFLCANKIAPGHIHHLDYGQITLGDYTDRYKPCGITQRMQQIAQDFEQAGIAIDCSDDLFLARWKKLVWNIPFNGLSVVLNAQTDQMMANPQTYALAKALMQEVVAAAAACIQHQHPGSDRQIPAAFITTMLDYTHSMKPYRTSMKIDYDEGRPLEVEAIFGNPLRMAIDSAIEVPRIQMLYQQLKFLDQQRSLTQGWF